MKKSNLLEYALEGLDLKLEDYKKKLKYYEEKGNAKTAQRYFEWISELKHERELLDKKRLKYSLDRYDGEFYGFE